MFMKHVKCLHTFLQAMLRGEVEILKDWCHEAVSYIQFIYK